MHRERYRDRGRSAAAACCHTDTITARSCARARAVLAAAAATHRCGQGDNTQDGQHSQSAPPATGHGSKQHQCRQSGPSSQVQPWIVQRRRTAGSYGVDSQGRRDLPACRDLLLSRVNAASGSIGRSSRALISDSTGDVRRSCETTRGGNLDVCSGRTARGGNREAGRAG